MSYQEFINQDFILCTMLHEWSEISNQDFTVYEPWYMSYQEFVNQGSTVNAIL